MDSLILACALLPTANAELPNAVFSEPIATELLFQEPFKSVAESGSLSNVRSR